MTFVVAVVAHDIKYGVNSVQKIIVAMAVTATAIGFLWLH